MTDWITDVIDTLGWFGVAVLVALENVFPPIPSEAVLPLAGYVSGRGGPSLPVLVAASTAGSVVGGLILYGIAAGVGTARIHVFVIRYGRWFGVDEGELERAEGWFDRRGSVAVLVGRCVPLIRSLVSLPAGARRMPIGRFTVLTAAGSAVWNVALLTAGRLLGEQWERVGDVLGVVQWVVIGAIGIAVAIYARNRVNRYLDARREASDRT